MNDRELFRLAPKQKTTRFGSKNCHMRKKTYIFVLISPNFYVL